MSILFWRYMSAEANTVPVPGFAMNVSIIHESGQMDQVLVNFTNEHTDEDIEAACAAAVVARTASEYPGVDVTGTRRIP